MTKRHISSKKSPISRDQLPIISVAVVVALAIIFVLISIFVLKVRAVAVVAIAVLEAMLGTSLIRIPIWLHGLVFIAQVVCGIIAGHVAFMVLMALIYVLTMAAIYLVKINE